jgi:hypothetical protein
MEFFDLKSFYYSEFSVTGRKICTSCMHLRYDKCMINKQKIIRSKRELECECHKPIR